MKSVLKKPALWMLLPALALLAFAYVVPLLSVFQIALREPSAIGITDGPFSLESLIQSVTDEYYWRIILRTALMGALTAILATVIAYPLALLIVVAGPKARNVLMVLAIAPMLISSVARTFGWVVILGNQGVINTVLSAFGLDRPIAFIGTLGGIVVALTEIFLPFAVLGMVSGFGRVSESLVAAARTLGASPFTAFRRVTLPLSMPGVIVAVILVFVLSISAYVTPRILGGGRIFVLGTEIFSEAKVTLNWPLAASLSIVLLAVFGAFIVISSFVRKRAAKGMTQ